MRRLANAVAGCVLAMTGTGVAAPSVDPGAMTVAAFGTSLTRRGGWQEALAARLQTCLGRPVTVLNLARSGATSEWGLGAVDSVVRQRPDAVLIEFSVNDASLHRFVGLQESGANVRGIVERLKRELPEARIYLMTMSPVIGMRGLIRPFLDDYYALYRDLSQELGTGFIDNRPAWATLSPDELEAALPDGSHPDPAVARRLIVPVIAEALSAGRCGEADGS
ncbi:MAG: SGNH/GDSL hydrolase family protein [Flavobacteriaceae bacterium]